MEATQNRSKRGTESREAAMRPAKWRPPETLPSPDPREGWTHRWIRVSVMGKDDPKNFSAKFREGFEPCKAEDYPELMIHAVDTGKFQGNIEVGGLLLCRIPTEFLNDRIKHYAGINRAEMEAVDNNFMRESDPRMPLFAEKKSKVTFGSGS